MLLSSGIKAKEMNTSLEIFQWVEKAFENIFQGAGAWAWGSRGIPEA